MDDRILRCCCGTIGRKEVEPRTKKLLRRNPIFAAAGQYPEKIFFKLALTRIPDHIRLTKPDLDPSRPTYESKEGELWLRVVSGRAGGLFRHLLTHIT